jgi:CheY-like chemotaxis protein
VGKQQEAHGRGAVLVVDDEEVVRNVAGALIEALGFTVLYAGDGIECLEVYKANSDAIVAVLLDVAMPGMDGAEALRELRRLDPEVRVLVTSGYPEAEAIRRFKGLGTAHFIEKPYRLSQLQARMDALLGDAG